MSKDERIAALKETGLDYNGMGMETAARNLGAMLKNAGVKVDSVNPPMPNGPTASGPAAQKQNSPTPPR